MVSAKAEQAHTAPKCVYLRDVAGPDRHGPERLDDPLERALQAFDGRLTNNRI
uniref:hypothetical protein n=1 Tax=Streptomyces sp. CA-141956 TaxID=3240051 RepID=UPI003F491BAA